MMTMGTSKYSWDELAAPSQENEFMARLVADEDNPCRKRIFWAKSWNSHPVLLVEYKYDVWRPISLPVFKNIRVVDNKNKATIAIELLDLDLCDIFLKVCQDIIYSLQDVSSKASRRACIFRLEKWSSFLRTSRARLSPEEQKGLIAELRFLERDSLVVHNEHDAICGWSGPELGARDFEYGQVLVEIKSKRSSANTSIAISSEEQLNVNESEQLFLCVIELNSTTAEDDKGFSLTDVVDEVRGSLESSLQRSALESKLAKIGYFDEDDYSDTRWSEGETYYYAVLDGFPKIDSQLCSPGVNRVTYQVDLDYCEKYLVDREQVINAMR